MKQGKSLQELALEVERQAKAKRDFVIASKAISTLVDSDGQIIINLDNSSELKFPVNQIAHRQIGTHLQIPATYYDRLQAKNPELLSHSINKLFAENTPKDEKRLVRTLDGKARCLASDRYRSLDNSDFLEAVLPVLSKIGVEVLSSDITESRLYLKVVDKRITRDIPTGSALGDGKHTFFDTLSPGLTLSNSEVCLGSVSAAFSIFTKVCTNLATYEQALRTAHVGAKLSEGVQDLLSDNTKRLTDAAIWSQLKDVVEAGFAEAQFLAYTDKLIGITENKITGDVVKVVELAAKKFGINEDERSSVLRHLIQGGDLTQYGLLNAVTRTAQDVDSYDRATTYEALAGTIIELPKNEWKVLAEAA